MVDRCIDQALLPRVGDGGHQDQVPQPIEQVGTEPSRIVAGIDQPVHRPEDRGTVADTDRLHHVVQQRRVRHAEQGERLFVGDAVRAGAGDELIEQRLRVTDRPAAGTDDERKHRRSDLHPFAHAVALEQVAHRRGRDEPERVVVRP